MSGKRYRLSRLDAGIYDGVILLEGRKYNFALVLYAYEHLIDALTLEFGGSSMFQIGNEGLHDWSGKARKRLLRLHLAFAETYDVATWYNVHRFGRHCRALPFLYGSDLCIAAPEIDRYETSRKRPVEEIDSEPRIVFSGTGVLAPYAGDFPTRMTLPYEMADRIEAVVNSPRLFMLRLRFERGDVGLGPEDRLCQDCRVSFPAEIYGAGSREYLRVRCLGMDGKAIKRPPRQED